jgi:O-antigen/teichoic acid export membrane protein
MSDNLKNQTINSVIWSSYDRFGSQLIAFVISVILARELAPEVFGLIAMLNIFLAIGQSFVDSGFGSALIQRKNTTEEHYSSVFYFNIMIGILMAVVLYFSAPLIASFFEQEILVSLSRVLALKFLILPFGLIQMNLLVKDLNFKSRTKVNIAATTLSGIIGVAMAFSGFGVWSLVAKMITRDIFSSIFLWIFNSWRPSRVFSFKAIKELFSFGSRMFFSGLLNVLFNNLYQIVIGRLFSPADLGYYTRARTLEQLPARNISEIVSTVTFSSFSKVQDDYNRLKSGMKMAVNYLMYINLPMMVGLALVARPLVIVLLTEKWLPSVTFIHILCLTGILFPLQVMNLNILKAKGRSDLYLRLEIFKKILTILNIAIAYRWGIIALIWGQVIVSFLSYYINSYFTGKLLDYGILKQLKDIIPYILQTFLMAVIVYAINFIGFSSDFVLLITQISTGLIVYFVFSILFKLPVLFDILDLLFEHVHFLKVFRKKYFEWKNKLFF